MTTETTTHPGGPEAAAWLDAARRPARRWFAAAALAATLETIFAIGRWAALAALAAAAIRNDRNAEVLSLGALVVTAALAVAAGWAAERLRDHGANAVTDGQRARLVEALLPADRRAVDTEAGNGALALVDLVDDVAGYLARVTPQRWATAPQMLAVLAATALVHWPAAVVLLLATALLPLNLRLAGVFARSGAARQLAATQRLTAVVLDSFRGLPTLRELGAVRRRADTLAEAGDRLTTATMSVLRRAFLSATIMDVVITFSIAADATYVGLSLLGYVHIPIAARLTATTGLLVLLVAPMYFAPMRAAAAAFHDRDRAITAAKEIARLAALRPPAGVPTRPAPIEAVGIVLDAVRFRYPGAERDVLLADADLAPGTWTAVAGASGAGKTTLLSLIAGIRQPSAGRVSWQSSAGTDVPLLGQCAWIGQHTVLLDASVRDNVRLGRPGAEEPDLLRAVSAAGLDPIVARLPHGLDTPLGEGGWGISTGEARRIAIARALLRDARLWLLDEPTAHLDSEAEAEVIAALRTATRGATVVVATHSSRLAAVADAVLAIDDGVLHDLAPLRLGAASGTEEGQ